MTYTYYTERPNGMIVGAIRKVKGSSALKKRKQVPVYRYDVYEDDNLIYKDLTSHEVSKKIGVLPASINKAARDNKLILRKYMLKRKNKI